MGDDWLWRLVYHIGGLTFLKQTKAEPLGGLPMAIRTAALQAVADHDPTVLTLELGHQTLWFSEGTYRWVVRWGYRNPKHQYQSVDAYFHEYGLTDPANQAVADEHFAERQFVEQVFFPLFGRRGLEQLRPQVAFKDSAGTLRHIDFVLEGTQRYAIEIEGATYHEQQQDAANFSNEKLRQRRLVRAGYHYYPFAWTDIEAGHAHRELTALAQADPLLGRLRESRHRHGDVPLHVEAVLADLPQHFPDMQCLVLDVLRQAAGRTHLTLADYQPHVATFTLAVLDTVALVERVAALYGLDVHLPEIDLHIVGTVPFTSVTQLLRHYLDDGTLNGNQRIDAAKTSLRLHWDSALPLHADLVVASDGTSDGIPEWAIRTEAIQARAAAFRTLVSAVPLDAQPLCLEAGLLDYFARRFFRVPELKREQAALIASCLGGESAFGILPTGFGKSLVFQLAALLLPRSTIVISPLTALIRDQVFNLRRAGITGVASITGSDSRDAKDQALRAFLAGTCRLLYVAPERLLNDDFTADLLAAVAAHPLGLFVVDEAHCVSEWGHDFRPAYLQLAAWRRRVEAASQRPLPLIALTATASNPVRDDVLHVLGLPATAVVQRASSDRPTLSLSVHAVATPAEKVSMLSALVCDVIPVALDLPYAELVPEASAAGYAHAGVVFGLYANPKQPGWIEEGVKYIADTLRDHLNRPPAAVRQYASSGTETTENERCQDAFQADTFPLLVATKGYGMGIDKRNIRFVIHHALAGGLEGYYQEAGRAGRDERHAHVALIYLPPHPDCRAESISQSEPPPCVTKRGSPECPYAAWLCDYGRQANFIQSSYPGIAEDVGWVDWVYGEVTSNPILSVSNKERDQAHTKKAELALCRLQQLGIVSHYTRRYHEGAFVVVLNEDVTPRSVRTALVQRLVESGVAQRNAREELKALVPSTEDNAALTPEFVQAAAQLLLERIYVRVMRMRYEMLRNQLEYAESHQEQRCRRTIIRNTFDPNSALVPDDYRCEFCDVCVPSLEFTHEQAVALSTDGQLSELLGHLTDLLDRWEPTALQAFIAFAEAQQAVAGAFMRATHRLEQDATNLGALYLAGALGRRRSGRERQALDYLRFGFNEGIRRGLVPDDLLLFYTEGRQIDHTEAFTWLTQTASPWNTAAQLPWLIREAEERLGTNALPYRQLIALYRARRARQVSAAFGPLQSRTQVLADWFARWQPVKDAEP